MGNPQRIICRLCLTKCDDFKAVEDYTKDVLEILLLKINLAISEKPVICTYCAAMLMRCFDFKATCVYTHDYIVPFLDGENISQLDLKKVYIIKYKNGDIPEDHGVCGFCMRLLEKYLAVSLDSGEGGVMLRKLIDEYLPELDLSTIKDPMICATCCESLKTCSHFVANCLIIEEKIMEYRKLTGADVIEIADVLQSTPVNVSRVKGNGNTIDIISTEENVCVNIGNADEQVGYENGSLGNMEGQKILPKKNAGIKPEQRDLYICLERVVLPQPVTIKLRGRRKCSLLKGASLNPTNKHKLTHKNVSEAAYKDASKITMHLCDFCSYQTKLKRYLRRHMLIHKNQSEIKMHRCDSCDFKTKRKDHLRRHMLTHKEQLETTMYLCDFCEFKTKHKDNLQRHLLIHKDHLEIMMYQCGICEFRTKRKDHLQRHLLIHKDHSQITMYQCDFCELKLKRKDSLQKHMLTHNNLPKIDVYHCDSCEFKTKRKQSLQRHITLNHKDH